MFHVTADPGGHAPGREHDSHMKMRESQPELRRIAARRKTKGGQPFDYPP